MVKEKIKKILRRLTGQDYLEIVTRGNSAITSALSIITKDKKVLIPEEGGWLSYRTIPKTLGLEIIEVKCNDSKIDLHDLEKKLVEQECGVFIYQNPGGYFAEQLQEEIHKICKKEKCLVVVDVSGSIGTELCNGKFADILVGSFGKWKLVEAHTGGFISADCKKIWDPMSKNLKLLEDETGLLKILQKLEELPQRIKFLLEVRDKIIQDIENLPIVHKNDLGFVVVVKYSNMTEKEKIINYCNKNKLEWTECPRYIRLNRNAISIEVKRL
ncbi:MAG: aminotransferase class I/II-fold pyridoxal phosphate-dependent enzyme [Nanoarchaeota archaeon]|nr:aminotransferase class I/II-fold pyridoxal phosphate-dependent enzyme [Nanoarchaeota archaeon]MBU1632416.1 aminotransferase class I/II-fold pyridoxal phosphate-dependent enzyme [Nanoarchaeota archaeon]MBU1876316.1 aminotransferase class I/II-fold pyridoxal phosphate-dependent enzyme [Nanoarchaeota archaeon]